MIGLESLHVPFDRIFSDKFLSRRLVVNGPSREVDDNGNDPVFIPNAHCTKRGCMPCNLLHESSKLSWHEVKPLDGSVFGI